MGEKGGPRWPEFPAYPWGWKWPTPPRAYPTGWKWPTGKRWHKSTEIV